jgi:ABC-2 type transport system permease protein
MTAVAADRRVPLVPLSLALARRSLLSIVRIPAAFVPIVAMPLFFVIAFSGSFSGLTLLGYPGKAADNILDWMVPFAICQGAGFAGFGTGFGTARDLENGFYDRYLLAPGSRLALLIGPVLSGFVRATISLVVVFSFSMLICADFPGGALGFVALWVAALGLATIATGWALGVVYRIRSQQAAPVLQVGIFFSMFLSTGQVPLDRQTGWVSHVARYNPITNVLDLARQGFIGTATWESTWPGLIALLGMSAVLWVFAARGLARLNT